MIKTSHWHYRHCLFPIALVGVIFCKPTSVFADIGSGPITCSQSPIANNIDDISFGAVDPLSSQTDTSATLKYACKGNGQESSARVCFTFGPLNTNDRKLSGPNNSLMAFNLFSDPSRKASITSDNPLQVVFNSSNSTTVNASITVYAQTLAGQTQLISGFYSLQSQVFMTVNSVLGSSAPPDCIKADTTSSASTYDFTYKSNASVSDHCTVTTAGALDLGRVSASTMPTIGSASNLINVTCTNAASYKIGLEPSNQDKNGKGVMKGSNGEPTLPYQLQSDASGTAWGNNGNTYAALTNGVTGTGNGAAQAHTVYVTVPNTDVIPDTYSDRVTVTVYY